MSLSCRWILAPAPLLFAAELLNFSFESWKRSTIQGLKYPCSLSALRKPYPFLCSSLGNLGIAPHATSRSSTPVIRLEMEQRSSQGKAIGKRPVAQQTAGQLSARLPSGRERTPTPCPRQYPPLSHPLLHLSACNSASPRSGTATAFLLPAPTSSHSPFSVLRDRSCRRQAACLAGPKPREVPQAWAPQRRRIRKAGSLPLIC